MNQNRWILPEGIDELLPSDAAALETLRRKLGDLYRCWGYELIVPPVIEYIDSLLTGTGHELDLQTFKLIDQLNGKSLGVRSDMTPQVARIDAHRLETKGINRLCYVGTTLSTRPLGFNASRSPLQLGAEIYGHAGAQSDVEVISLMLATLKKCTNKPMYLDLGHVGIFRGLASYAELSEEQENSLFDMMQRKSVPEIAAFVDNVGLSKDHKTLFLSLVHFSGGEEVLEKGMEQYANINEDVTSAFMELREIVNRLKGIDNTVQLHLDLSELRGYSYHTGVVFAAYLESHGQEIARGGRYDDIGRCFGRPRPATGFSTDLKILSSLHQQQSSKDITKAIYVPDTSDQSVWEKISQLRNAGEIVACALSDSIPEAETLHFDRVLIFKDGNWIVEQYKYG